jgi:hypothetical protein
MANVIAINAIPLKTTHGILDTCPKHSTFIQHDALEVLNMAAPSTLTKNLWSLLCSLVKSDFEADPNCLKSMSTETRYQLYFTKMEETLENYPFTDVGAKVLKYFNPPGATKLAWPEELLTFWETLKNKCSTGLNEYRQTKKCPLIKDVSKSSNSHGGYNLIKELQVRVFIGNKISDEIDETVLVVNNHLNKQWPSKFNSGESPSGTLLQIRR